MKRRSSVLLGLLAGWALSTVVLAPGLGMAQAEKVKASMTALIAKTGALGSPKINGVNSVGGEEAAALYFGSTKINGD